jgi:hypothetical protein
MTNNCKKEEATTTNKSGREITPDELNQVIGGFTPSVFVAIAYQAYVNSIMGQQR